MSFRLALTPSPAFLVLLALAFLLPGLVTHDPWKTVDVLSIEAAHQMAQSGALLIPRVAGEVWLGDPPLYAWVALGFGKLFSALFGFHGAARLASGAFVFGALWLTYLCASAWSPPEHKRDAAPAALLALLGSVGLIVHAHEATPDLALLFAIAGVFATLPFAQRRPLGAGALCGVALGVAFLSAGPLVPLILLLCIGACALASSEWRTRRLALFVLAAALLGTAIAAAWEVPAYRQAPQTVLGWWIETLALRDDLPQAARYFLVAGLWFAWPAWPLAAWSLWIHRRRIAEPRLLVPAVSSLALLASVVLFAPRQDIQLTVLLVPLALLASQGVSSLRRGAAAALDWFGVMTFAFFAGLVWLGYVAMMTGVPPRVARNFVKTAPGFVAEFEPFALLAALALTVGWIVVAFFAARSPCRPLLRWAVGTTLLWGSFALLWLPWVDYQKSYQSVALQLRSSLPVGSGCIARRGVGLPQRAALSYHGGFRMVAWDPAKPNRCRVLIIQGSPKHELDHPGSRWRKRADVGRPGDKSERYRLYTLAPL